MDISYHSGFKSWQKRKIFDRKFPPGQEAEKRPCFFLSKWEEGVFPVGMANHKKCRPPNPRRMSSPQFTVGKLAPACQRLQANGHCGLSGHRFLVRICCMHECNFCFWKEWRNIRAPQPEKQCVLGEPFAFLGKDFPFVFL